MRQPLEGHFPFPTEFFLSKNLKKGFGTAREHGRSEVLVLEDKLSCQTNGAKYLLLVLDIL